LIRALHAIALVSLGIILVAFVVSRLGFTWYRFLLVMPMFLVAVVVSIAPKGDFLSLSIILGWVWAVAFTGVLALSLIRLDFLLAGVLLLTNAVGWLGCVAAIPFAFDGRRRQRDAT
jgi:hypothetical protein